MYCVKCGVELANTEKKCPLCQTPVCCPQSMREEAEPLFPPDKMPPVSGPSGRVNGAALIIFLIPLLVSLVCDLLPDGEQDWFGFVAGALMVCYVSFALPLWFRRPKVAVFAPCSCAAAVVYLLYIDLATGGGWFLPFGLPVAGTLSLIVCAAAILLYYLPRGRLYVLGGTALALGGFMILLEGLMAATFRLPFHGWSVYAVVGLGCLGCLLLYLAISAPARDTARRKLFF